MRMESPDTQHRHHRIGRSAAFTLGVMRINQGNQTLPRHHPIHLDQEQLFAGLLALAGLLGIGEGHLLHRKTRRLATTGPECVKTQPVVVISLELVEHEAVRQLKPIERP